MAEKLLPGRPCGASLRRLALATLTAFVVTLSFAAPVSLEQVNHIAPGVASSVQVSYASGAAVKIAQAVSPAETVVSAVSSTNSTDTAFYVIDRGSTGGFVSNPILRTAQCAVHEHQCKQKETKEQ